VENRVPRTEMICELCGGFSSTPRCHPCSTSGAGRALSLAEIEIVGLKAWVAELEAIRRDER